MLLQDPAQQRRALLRPPLQAGGVGGASSVSAVSAAGTGPACAATV
jgi:hypothetical protein